LKTSNFAFVEGWVVENSISEIVVMTRFPKKLKEHGFEVREHLLVKKV